MKSVLILGLVFVSTLSFSSPIPGDYARYLTVETLRNGATSIYEIKKELISMDPIKRYCTTRTISHKNGVLIEDETHESNISYCEIESASSTCDRLPFGGWKIEMLTVAAGTFRACHFPMPWGSEVSYEIFGGGVLFGNIKTVYQNSNPNSPLVSSVMELVELVQH